jgi:hypothetical protein
MARDDANGMSSVLSSRAVQPGTINTGRPHELDVFIAMADALDIDCHCANTHVLENAIWQVTYQPSELRHCFGKYGLMPDIRLLNKQTNRVMYFEVKFQGHHGNAEERAGKLFTHHFVDWFMGKTGMPYHAYRLIFTGALATDAKYTDKFQYLYDSDEYLCWDGSTSQMREYLDLLCQRYLFA